MSPSPIRSNRGRAAVWRSVWSWPLASRTRAAFTLIATIIAVLLAGRIVSLGHTNETGPAHPPAPAATPAPPATNPPPQVPAAPAPGPITASGPPAPQEALHDAAGFMSQWITHQTAPSPGSWVARLAPYTAPEQLGQLATIDPNNVTATRLAGDPTVTRVDDALVELDWPTDDGAVHLTLIHPMGPWQVTAVSGSGP